MAQRTDGNNPLVTVYHVKDGPCEMYAIDANTACQLHPAEWSRKPWPKQKHGHGTAKRLPAGGSILAKPE
jgi:hypothetical protein